MAAIEKMFPSYLAALAECGDGYNDADIAKVIAYRTVKWKDALKEKELLWADQATNPVLAVGIAAADQAARPLRVLDFGGGCGIHYFFARVAFRLPLRWAIVETQRMLEHAALISAGEFETHNTIACAVESLGGADLVLTSGAVQYTPDPMSTFDALIAIGASYFMLARFPFSRETMFTIEQAPLSEHMQGFAPMPPGMIDKSVKCPITFVKYSDVRSKFDHAYDRLLSLPAPSADYQVRDQMILGGTNMYRRKS